MYFEWPWFISRLIYVSHYMFVNWRRRKNWVIFWRPITLNLSPTIHYKVKILQDHWVIPVLYWSMRSQRIPKHFHMLQQNNFFYRLSAVSINTKHIWATIRGFFALYFTVPVGGTTSVLNPFSIYACLCIDDNIQRTFQSFLFN